MTSCVPGSPRLLFPVFRWYRKTRTDRSAKTFFVTLMWGSLILVIACLPLFIRRGGLGFAMRDARQPIHRSFKGFGIDPPVPRHRPRQYPIANPLPIGCNAYSSAFSRLFICQPALLHPVLVHRPRCATKSSSITASALVTPTRHRHGQPGRGHLWQPKASSRGKGCT